MTKSQIILKKWVEKNFERVSITFDSVDTATITDLKGDKMTISLNLYCDIIEVKTKKILAISNLPHELEKMGTTIPTSWREIPYMLADRCTI